MQEKIGQNQSVRLTKPVPFSTNEWLISGVIGVFLSFTIGMFYFIVGFTCYLEISGNNLKTIFLALKFTNYLVPLAIFCVLTLIGTNWIKDSKTRAICLYLSCSIISIAYSNELSIGALTGTWHPTCG